MFRLTVIILLLFCPCILNAQANVDALDKDQRNMLKLTKLRKVQIGNNREGFAYFVDKNTNNIYSVEERGIAKLHEISDSAVLIAFHANFKNDTVFRIVSTFQKGRKPVSSVIYLKDDSIVARKDIRESIEIDLAKFQIKAYDLLARAKALELGRPPSN